jgi:hypothetical protein
MTHESRESQVKAKHWHGIWKWVSIASAVVATVNLFLATGAIVYHSLATKEHQDEIDRIDSGTPNASEFEFIRTEADGVDPSGVNDLH